MSNIILTYPVIIVDLHVVIVGGTEKVQYNIKHKENVHKLIYEERDVEVTVLTESQQIRWQDAGDHNETILMN